MILVEEVLTSDKPLKNSKEDFLDIEWYETSKSIIRRKTRNGVEVAIRKNNKRPLDDGDLLYIGDGFHVIINILPCDCIVVDARDKREMGMICFEIGNLHLPIYIDPQERIMVSYEAPLFNLLEKAGYKPIIEEQKLLKIYELRIVKGHINRL